MGDKIRNHRHPPHKETRFLPSLFCLFHPIHQRFLLCEVGEDGVDVGLSIDVSGSYGFYNIFNKAQRDMDKWLYAFKNIGKFYERPKSLDGPEMDMLYESAKITSFGSNDLLNIHRCLMNENDRIMYECQTRERNIREGREEGLKIGLEQGLEQGREEGRRNAMIEMAKALLETGMAKEQIMSMTGLEEADIA